MRKKILFTLVASLAITVSKAQYCMPETNCTVGDGIVEFGMGPFYNPSTCSSDFGIPGYGDFTGLTVPVGQGNTETVLLRSDFASQQISIWIDMDNSESFEANELILADEPVGLDVVFTSVTIPSSLAFGDYTMRVQATFAGPSSIDPCNVGTFGETEDYTVSVGPPPTCLSVSNIEIDMIGSDQAQVSWTDAGTGAVWDIEFGPAGFTPTGMPSPGYDDITNPILLTGLNPATDYQVYVRADCGMDNVTDVSFWSIPSTFTTECAAITPFYLNDMNNLPFNCWEFANGGNLADGPQFFGFSNWFDGGFANNGNFTGAQQVFFFGSNANEWMLTPFFNLSGGTYQAEFDIALTQAFNATSTTLGDDDFLAFLVTEDFAQTWNVVELWDANNPLDNIGEHFITDLSAISGTDVQFAFLASNGTIDDFIDFQFHIDNFVIQDLGACVATYNVQANNISSDAAEISWTDPGNSSAWDIEFGPAGFTPTGMPSPGYDDVTNPTMLTGLTPLTSYDVYVRADCGMDNMTDISYWSSALNFTTACANFSPTYLENFNGFPLECWESANGGNIDEGPQDFNFSNWFDGGFANLNSFTGAQRVSFFGPDQYQWLISPLIDLSAGDYQLELDFALTETFVPEPVTLGSDDKVAVLMSEDFGASWDILQEWDSSSVVTFSGEHLIYDLSAFSGENTRFAIFATTDSINDFINFQVHVDNFLVQDLGAELAVQIDQSSDLNCGGDSSGVVLISVNGGALPYSFLWSDGSTSEDLTGADAGEHFVTVTDGNGNSFISDVVTLNEPPPIIIDGVVTDESVNGANDGAIDISVSGGMPPYSFQWNNGSMEEDLSDLIDALWCVNVTDLFGCSTQQCFTVNQGPSSVGGIEDLNYLNIYPNPAESEINLELSLSAQKNLSVSLKNYLGQNISSNAYYNATEIFTKIDLSHIAKGFYMLEFTDLDSGQTITKKFLKNN